MADRHPRLTRFLAQELLYEYISGSLDPARYRLVEVQVEGDRESQRELLNLSKGLEYAHEIGRMSVSPALHHALLNFEPAWKKNLRAWTRWSSRHGWRALPYAFTFGAVALTVVVTKPWLNGGGSDLTLVEQPHVEPRSIERDPPREVAAVAPPAPADVPAPAVTVAPAPTVEVPAVGADSAQSKGRLLRGELAVKNFSANWPAIRDKIVALGGTAAGSVELGWLRRKDQSYFHFSLPQPNEDELTKYLGTFGPVQIKREGSPRVMPQGQIRIILTVKDGGIHEGPAKAP